MIVDGITLIAFPLFEVVGEGYADALSFQVVLGIDAAGIVEHDVTILAQSRRQEVFRLCSFLFNFIDGAFVLYKLFPPLYVLVVDAEQRLVAGLPLVSLGDVTASPCHTDIQRFADSLITRAVTTDIGHPILVFVFTDAIAATPCPVDEGGETTALVHVPAIVLVGKDASLCRPVQ